MESVDQLSMEELKAQLVKLQEENQQLKKKKQMCLKVSEKGAVQINGIRRFPITLYRSEIQEIFSKKNEIETFIEENSNQLK